MMLRVKAAGAGMAAVLFLSSHGALAACHYPTRPTDLPNGVTATFDQMVAAQQLIKQYNADMEAYLRCLDEATPKPDDITSKLTPEERQAIVKQIELLAERKGAAVADEQAVVERYNEQVNQFKARQTQQN